MSKTPHSFQDYKALLHLAADAFNAKHATKRHPIHNAIYHNLDELAASYDYNGVDIVTMLHPLPWNGHQRCYIPQFHPRHACHVFQPQQDENLP